MSQVNMTPHPCDQRDHERQVAYFIPSVELKGTRAEKLQKLDTLIAYLEQLRRSIGGGIARSSRGGFEGPSRFAASPAWPWWVAGMLLSAVVALLVLLRMNP
jgi:hypothetical protein